jgi:AraC-like DNA-binding protein
MRHHQELVSRTLRRIERHLDERWSLSTLGDHAGVSTSYLSKVVASATGVSPVRLVRLLRLKRASMHLVFSPGRHIPDIAFDAGFRTSSRFHARFGARSGRRRGPSGSGRAGRPGMRGTAFSSKESRFMDVRIVTKVIASGRCSAAPFLVEEWLPASGETWRGDYLLFHYVNVGPDVPDHEMITDVYLPLR